MLIVIFGESCTGKSTLAEALKARTGAAVYSGKDYLRLAKSESMAKALFQKQLKQAAAGEDGLIYVIAEPELLSLVPEGGVRVLVTAGLDEIKARFAARLGGTLPPPVAAMLERKHGCFDQLPHDVHIVSGVEPLDSACDQILSRPNSAARSVSAGQS